MVRRLKPFVKVLTGCWSSGMNVEALGLLPEDMFIFEAEKSSTRPNSLRTFTRALNMRKRKAFLDHAWSATLRKLRYIILEDCFRTRLESA
jgi:hypothetical protein